MINCSIPKVELKKLNTFGQVTNNKPSDYWLPSEKKEEKQQVTLDPKNIKSILITPDEARKTNNIKIIGLSIAGATVLTAGTLFFILKGGPQGLARNFVKWRDYLQDKIQRDILENKELTSAKNKIYLFGLKFFDSAVQRTEAINNFTTFKDLLFKRMMSVTKPLRKIHDGITKMFEDISIKSVAKSYKKTNAILNETVEISSNLTREALLHAPGSKITINGKTLSKSEWLEQIEILNKEIVDHFDTNFGTNGQKGRYSVYKKAAESLKTSFSKLRTFWSKDLYSKFMAESAIIKNKQAVQVEALKLRRQIAFSAKDLYKDADDTILKISALVPLKDSDKITMLGNLRNNIKNKVTESNFVQTHAPEILKEISRLKSTLLDNANLSEEQIACLSAEITKLNDLIASFKPGKVDEILDIYKCILSPKDYKIIKKTYSSIINSLDKSIRLETEEFVSKLRDLVLGSAPTDILSILGGLGVLGYQLGKSEDNDQRISISLKYGIPALAGIGVSLYCNAKLYAGTKSLLIGTLSSFALNKIGVLADDALKKYYKNDKKSQANISPEMK